MTEEKPKFTTGQKVTVCRLDFTNREVDTQLIGLSGRVINYESATSPRGGDVIVYTVDIDCLGECSLYEFELEPALDYFDIGTFQ